MECNGIQMVLSIAEDARFDHPSSVFYFQVDNIHSSYETLVERNVHALMSEVPVSE